MANPGGGLRPRHILIFAAAAVLCAVSSPAGAFYLPGVAPRDFQKVIDRPIPCLLARMFPRFLSLSDPAVGACSQVVGARGSGSAGRSGLRSGFRDARGESSGCARGLGFRDAQCHCIWCARVFWAWGETDAARHAGAREPWGV